MRQPGKPIDVILLAFVLILVILQRYVNFVDVSF